MRSHQPPTAFFDPNQQSHTAPINDPDIIEALRQLKAGETVPERTQDDSAEIGLDGERNTPKKRAVYTREHKLAAIHFATTTHRVDHDGTTRIISLPEAAQTLNVNSAVLAAWVRDVARIKAMPPGSQKHRSKAKKVRSCSTR